MAWAANPTVTVLRLRMLCARLSGWKANSSIAARAFPSVAARTESGVFRLLETVPTETPDRRATSRIVAGPCLIAFNHKLPRMGPTKKSTVLSFLCQSDGARGTCRLVSLLDLDPPSCAVHYRKRFQKL